MEAFWTVILNKIISECGALAVIPTFFWGLSLWNTAKIRQKWEADRADMEKAFALERDKYNDRYIKAMADSNQINKDLVSAVAATEKIEGMLVVLSNR